jgi:hypothetical protein
MTLSAAIAAATNASAIVTSIRIFTPQDEIHPLLTIDVRARGPCETRNKIFP